MQINKMGFLLAGLVLLPGCYRVAPYRSKSLKFLSNESTYRKSKNGLVLRVKRLTRDDKKKLFGYHSKKLSSKANGQIEVIYLSLHNHSPIDYSLSSLKIDLEIVPHDRMMGLMKTTTIGRFMGAFASVLGSGFITLTSWFGLSALVKSRVPVLSMLIPGFWFSGIYLASRSADRFYTSAEDSVAANHRIDEDLEEKTSCNGVLIASGDGCEWIIFVKNSDYRSQFNVVIPEQDNRNNKVTFKVDLQQS